MNTGVLLYPNNNVDTLVNPLTAMNTVYTNNTNVSFITLPLSVNPLSNEQNISVIDEPELFPNPSREEINISMPSTESYYVEIINPFGNIEIVSKNQNQVNISG